MDRVTPSAPPSPPGAESLGIPDLWRAPLAEIPTQGGPVLHMLRADSPLFQGFGEVYFSVVEPGAVKAWKLHKRQTQHFAVPCGLMEVVLFDQREHSPARGRLERVTLGRPGHYALLRIPPGLWYGFTNKGPDTAVLANCADIPHDPEESLRLPWDSPDIPHRWGG